MKAEGNICYPLVVSYWKQSQRGKERGAHSRYIISCHIVGIWTSWYDKLIGELFAWEQGKKKSLLIMAQPYKKKTQRKQDILWYQKQAHLKDRYFFI